MAHPGRIKVTTKECRGIPERMIRRFTKKVKKEGILETVKERRHYKKPSVAKKEKRIKAERRRLREERKRKRAQERRNRKI
jgi:ribosomal protein S21|tara:strand:+ start:742 stop:984 length:243 start_codon:yes stop_codon:yes gene_type:complete